MIKLKYPKFLKAKDSVYLVSPSFGCSYEPYKSRLVKAIENLKKLGFNVCEGRYIFQNDSLLSTTKENICAEFIEAYKTADLLLSVGGGEWMLSILDTLDFSTLKKLEPKWFMGYSDNTNITFLLTTLCDTASIYGANAGEFGVLNFYEYEENMLAIIKGEKLIFNNYLKYELNSLKNESNPYVSLNLDTPVKMDAYPLSNITLCGRLLGGCIDSLSALVGTKFDNVKKFSAKYKNIIWFLEACDMTPIEVARRLLQMKYAGWFDEAIGFIFGRPLHTEEMFNKTYKELIIEALEDLGVDIIFDADIGHLKPQIPIICGSKANITYKDNKLTIEYILE